MKTMTCKQLGGACDEKFQANTFEEMAALSKQHGMQMFTQGDEAHISAMQKMRSMMDSPDGMQKWFADRKAEFDALPVD